MAAYPKTSFPHIRATDSVLKIMWKTNAALIPAILGCLFLFPFNALCILAVSCVTSVLTEIFSRSLFQKKQTSADGSAILTALLFAIMLPPSIPSWMAALGSFTAIFLGKETFGGLGSSLFNPAVVGFVFLRVCFPWAFHPDFHAMAESLLIPILIGGLILIWQKLIRWEIPLTFLMALYVFSLSAGHGLQSNVLSGSVFLFSFFILTDSVTAPMTKQGRVLFSMAAAALTVLLSRLSSSMESMSFTVLILNAAGPWFDYVRPEETVVG